MSEIAAQTPHRPPNPQPPTVETVRTACHEMAERIELTLRKYNPGRPKKKVML